MSGPIISNKSPSKNTIIQMQYRLPDGTPG